MLDSGADPMAIFKLEFPFLEVLIGDSKVNMVKKQNMKRKIGQDWELLTFDLPLNFQLGLLVKNLNYNLVDWIES